MAQLAVQKVDLTGESINFTAADAAGDKFSNNGTTILRINNGAAADITATISSLKPCSQGFTHDVAIDVPAGSEIEVGPFAPTRFNDAQGNVSITYSSAATVTVAAVRQ